MTAPGAKDATRSVAGSGSADAARSVAGSASGPAGPRASRAALARLRRLAPDGPDEMGRELAEGPRGVGATLARVERDREVVDRMVSAAERIVLVGTGASLAMARTAAPWWRRGERGEQAARPVVVRESAEAVFGGPDGDTFRPGDLLVAISQSGGSPETLAAARRGAEAGARVLAVTAHGASPLGSVADLVVETPVGHEEGAATKSELAALAALLAMASPPQGARPHGGSLGGMPPEGSSLGVGATALEEWLASVVASWSDVLPAAERLAGARRTWFVGLGSSAGIAHAASLLWHEKAHRQVAGTTVSEFRHGPIEAVTPRDAVVVVVAEAPSPGYAAYLAMLRRELHELGATSIWIAPVIGHGGSLTGIEPLEASGAGPDRFLSVPLPDPSSPGPAPVAELLGTTLRIQQLARATAHAAGTYVDGFRVLRQIVRAAPPAFD